MQYHIMRNTVVAPSLKVGDCAIVLFCNKLDQCFDISCGNTTVVEIKKNGTVVLQNGFKFHANGQGHARNNACLLSDRTAVKRDIHGMPL